MPKSKKFNFYAVRKGRVPGIYKKWDECQAQTNGFSGVQYKGFATEREAEAYLKGDDQPPASTTERPKPYERPAPLSEQKNQEQSPATNSAPKISVKGMGTTSDETGWTVVYTDGACSNNGQPGARGGIGVWWSEGSKSNVSERLPGDQTNNRAELIAIVRALETDSNPEVPLLIKTDSSYSMQCLMQWLPKWRTNGYRTSTGADIKNKALILYLSSLIDARPGPTKFEHVKGHAGIYGNEMADRLAVEGTRLPAQAERDWSFREVENSRRGSVEFEVFPEDLLDLDELAEMERTQNFD